MDLPMPLLSDSYKASHYKSYPDSTEMIAVSLCSASSIMWPAQFSQCGTLLHGGVAHYCNSVFTCPKDTLQLH